MPLIAAAPSDAGTVELIVRRPSENERWVLASGYLDLEEGLLGDTWRARGNRHTPDGTANPEAQITLMNARFAGFIAGSDHDDWARAGDQFFVDYDLGESNVPPGTKLQIGEAVIEVTAHPHLGCAKLSSRFGADALRFVNTEEGRSLRARGANARVISPGLVQTGAVIAKAGA